MKKSILLIASFLIVGSSISQFTVDNAPVIGTSQHMAFVDSATVNYATIKGEGVEWDYSELEKLTSTGKMISIINPSDSSYHNTFDSSELAYETEDFLISYMTEEEGTRKSQGFVFNGDPLGDLGYVSIKFEDETPATLYSYPMDYGAIQESEFDGEVNIEAFAFPMRLYGHSKVEVDGVGTLKLFENTIENVTRYALIDTMYVVLVEEDIEAEEPELRVLITRTHFDYFKHDVSNMPLFSHTKVTFEEEMDNGIYGEFSVVLAYEGDVSSLTENVLMNTVLYPNPVTDHLNIELPSSVESATVTLTDATGRTVLTSKIDAVNNALNVSTLQKGTYFLKLSNEEQMNVQTVVIQ